MDRFPKLKTGALAQYPAEAHALYSTETRRFLDSSEQRYRNYPASKRTWRLGLDLLTSSELADIREFFVRMRGSQTEFEFEDPWTGIVVSPCRFGDDEFTDRLAGENSEEVVVTIRES